MSKRSIAYIKPEEPNFLKRMKAEIGYKEDTSIELKRANLPRGPEDLPELEDSEVPQIVVLAPGDLTEEQFKAEKARINKEEEQKPADLSQRVIFKRREKPGKADKDDQEKQAVNGCSEKPRKKKEAPKPRPIVSFDDDCDDE